MIAGRLRSARSRKHHEVSVRLDGLKQLFNSMDPSPFYEKDLDPDAERYIVSWAEEYPLDEPVSLVLHLDGVDPGQAPEVERAVHNHFQNQARLARLEFRHVMRVGSRSLAIGLGVLGLCLALSEALHDYTGTLADLLRQSLVIGGWVAMWQPMQTYLYGWWPLRRRRRIYEKLGHMPVHIRDGQHAGTVRRASSP